MSKKSFVKGLQETGGGTFAYVRRLAPSVKHWTLTILRDELAKMAARSCTTLTT